jgi:HK97 family phage prohead protease
MPIPKPEANEGQDKFIARCMKALNEDYPDQKQRSAICYDAWRKRNRREGEPETMKTFFLLKGKDYERHDMSIKDLADWFFQHSDENGVVKEDMIMLADAEVKYSQAEGVEWTMSDESIDRDKEVIRVDGWNLKAFKKNPVVLWGHDSSRPAIGKVMNPRIKDGLLRGKVKFDPIDIDPFAGMIEAKVKNGTISAGSVGFKPIQVEPNTDEDADVRLTYLKQELREFSICNIPANPNAVVNPIGREAEDIVDAKYDDLVEEIRSIKDDLGKVKEMQIQLMTKKDDKQVNPISDFLTKKEAPKPYGLNNLLTRKAD